MLTGEKATGNPQMMIEGIELFAECAITRTHMLCQLYDGHTPREYHPWEKAQFMDALDDVHRSGKLGEDAETLLRMRIGLLEEEGKFLSEYSLYPDCIVLSRGARQPLHQNSA